MKLSSKTFSRDDFVTSLATWLRWRGHTVPHNMLAQRFSILDENPKYADLVRVTESLGVHLHVKKYKKSLPDITNFPLIAIVNNSEIKPVRQVDAQGRALSAQVAAESTIIQVKDITAWLSVSLSVKKLHHEIFGTENQSGQWFWSAFTRNWWAYVQAAIATGFASMLGLAAAVYSMQIYDRVIPSDSTDTLMVLTVGVVIVYVLELILKTFRAYVIDYAGKKLI